MATLEDTTEAVQPSVTTARRHILFLLLADGLSSRWAYVLCCTVSASISQTWFKGSTFIATGDIVPFVRDGLSPEIGWLWNHAITGIGYAFPSINQAWELSFVHLVHVLGGDPYLAQRVLLAIVFAATAGSVCLFATQFVPRNGPVAVAGLISVVNPLSLTMVPNLLPFVALTLVCLLGGLLLLAAKGGRRHQLAFALIFCGTSYLLANPPLLVVVVVTVFALGIAASTLVGKGATGRALRFLLWATPFTVIFNLWWIVPAALSVLNMGQGSEVLGATTDAVTWSWTHARSSIANTLSLVSTWTWGSPLYVPSTARLDPPIWAALRFLLPGCALAAPLVARRQCRRVALVWSLVALLLVFLTKGLHPPLRAVNLWVYQYIPGFWLFREPTGKFGPLLVISYAVLVALFVDGLLVHYSAQRAKNHPYSLALATTASLALIGALANPYPLWNGTLTPDHRLLLPSAHVRVPSGWFAAASYLNHSPRQGKVLMLPLDDYYQMLTTWGFYGADATPRLLIKRPVHQRLPGEYFADDPHYGALLAEAERGLTGGADGKRTRELFDELDQDLRTISGISWPVEARERQRRSAMRSV